VQIWNNASSGCPSPIEVTINPSCLVVEYATIFFMSCWAVAVDAANSAVILPRINITACIGGALENRASVRTKRNTPATTIVEL